LIFGYGIVEINDVNINDSMYLGIVYKIGFFGLFIILSKIFFLIINRIDILPISFYFVMFVILISGIGSKAIMGFRLDIYLTALLVTSIFPSLYRIKD